MALPTYSSRCVNLSWSGAPITGLAPDSFITFSRASSLTEAEVGADGIASISKLPDRTGTCTVSLQQNSPGNHILSGIIKRQEAICTLITGTLAISDPAGSVLATLTGVHLQEAPEVSLGSSANGSTLDWVFWCEGMEFTSTPEGASAAVTGNVTISGGIETIMSNA